ncbi:hypothetical protein N0V84_007741 [Fusarium piperis]|uniref:Uncharacterized protein n=1 Tax=Fusarium piperis TaxID=1435070 RepID=A0A9W8W9H0_9HYPO|nr:hypothetical protein N0V84_007741 [Fusarium piperis]
MSHQEILAPNLNRYSAPSSGRYLSTRLVTHNGITIAVALGKAEGGSLFFAYSILNAEEEDQVTKAKASATEEADTLDSQCWFENVKVLQFPSEFRVVGEEAVPVYEIPAVDRSSRKAIRALSQKDKLNTWLSSSLCLMDPEVTDFQVLSNGRYVYLFRQGASAAKASPSPYMTDNEAGKPPVDGNLLCDRFTLVRTTLSQPLEARYQRSRQVEGTLPVGMFLGEAGERALLISAAYKQPPQPCVYHMWLGDATRVMPEQGFLCDLDLGV